MKWFWSLLFWAILAGLSWAGWLAARVSATTYPDFTATIILVLVWVACLYGKSLKNKPGS